MATSPHIPFNRPLLTGREAVHIKSVLEQDRFADGGPFGVLCANWLKTRCQTPTVYLTASCTQALEMAALLIDIQVGDEVILPSFTYVSTANAFVLRGARLVFVDINPNTLCMDETKLEAAIGLRTKAIVPVHYGGFSCNMERVMELADSNGIWVIEDAAHGIGSSRFGKSLGSFGHLGALSFHETKNLHCGEGGALLIRDERLLERAAILKEKGTDRANFLAGQIPAYTWQEPGSAFVLNELSAAFLWGQFESADSVLSYRRLLWKHYLDMLKNQLEPLGVRLPNPGPEMEHTGHVFYLICRSSSERTALQMHLRMHGIEAVSHYEPLHLSKAGASWGRFSGEDKYTTRIAQTMLRLPMHFQLRITDIDRICQSIVDFYSQK